MNFKAQVADILEDAARYIAEHGHTKNQLEDPETGAVCLWGALCHVTDSSHIRTAIADAMVMYAEPFGYTCEIKWNNAPETTGEDVILGMKTVAFELREKGSC